MKPKIIFLVGPTASGKSLAAVYLAKRINAEIVSCDSMQIYKGMDIITSKASPALRKKVKHHLVGVIAPDEDYNVSRYRLKALGAIKDINKRGKVPLLVGGTGLYMSILIDGLFKEKTENKNIRRQLYQEAARAGSAHLYGRLLKVDPQAAAKIHPHDTKRITRALEVFLVTGKPISALQKERKGLGDEYAIRIFCLNLERGELYKRIDARVDKMFRQGLLKEAKKLLKMKLSQTASCAIGIKELKGYLEGRYDLEEVKRLIKRNSRHYAKRQLTWFRKDKRIEWIDIGRQEKPRKTAEGLWKKLYS